MLGSPPDVAPPPPDALIGRTLGRYRIDEKLGGGGMGIVYRAWDASLERDVALKFLPHHLHANSEARDRLIREARAASSLAHANVASVYEIGEAEDGRLFIVMPFYDGETLKQRIARGSISPEETVRLALHIADGLDHAHEAGIVHRDVKPANVMLVTSSRSDRERAVVVDFGIAETETASGLAATSGTAAYMSPEQAAGAPSDARTDVWGLGVTLYEMLSGRRPFDGPYASATLYAIQHEAAPPLPDAVPRALAEIVTRCLAKNPDDRFADMAVVAAALRTAGGGTTSLEARPSLGSWAVHRFRHASVVVRAGAVLLAVAAAIGLWALATQLLGPRSVQHLAVLPFRTLGEDPEAESIAAGLVETITSQVGQLVTDDGTLWVIPASEIEPGLTAADARDRLGATMVVDGTVQLEGGRTRVTLNLIDTQTRRQIGSDAVDERDASPLALQDQAVLKIAKLLRVEIGSEERERLEAGGTEDRVASDLYLRGRGVLRNAATVDELQRASDLFARAVDRDRAYARAHAGVGEAMWRTYKLTDDIAYAEAAVAATERALDIAPDLPEVLLLRADLYAERRQYDRAIETYDHVLSLDSTFAEAERRRALVLSDQGRLEEAEASLLHAITLRPNFWRGYSSLAAFYRRSGRLEDAIEAYRRGLTMAPSNLTLLNGLAASQWEADMEREAEITFEQIRRIEPEHPRASVNLATLKYYQEDYGAAAELYAEHLERFADQYRTRQYYGDALWWAGQHEQARAAYRRSIVDARSHLALARSPDVLQAIAFAYSRLGIADSAEAYIHELRVGRPPSDIDPDMAFNIGSYYEALGNREEALRWIRSALERGAPREYLSSPWLRSLSSSL